MKRKKREPRKLRYWLWGILLIVLSGGAFWLYHTNLAGGAINYAVAQTGTITHERQVTATFANQETPLLAPRSGKVQYVAEDGQRYRRGETLATVQADGSTPGIQTGALSQTILAPMGGLFYRQTDGLESIVTGENLLSMDLTKLLAQKATPKTAGASVQMGEVVGKVVNNNVPSGAFLELSSLEGITVGKTLRIQTGIQTVSVKILRKSEKPMGVVVQFPYYVDGSALKRTQEVTWIYLPSTSGVLVPKSALWTEGGELGMFLWDGGVWHFKQVKVLDQDDTLACIEDLPSGIPVVITPRAGLEGLIADIKNF